jgi:cyclic pyranopterin phosphate synthase
MATIIPLTDARTVADPNARRARAGPVQCAMRRSAPVAPAPIADTRGRRMHDLRISVTDRCNFRCVYSMPKNVFDANYTFLPHADLLTFEEIARVAGIFVARGVSKIRLTGGEPLLRRNIERLVEMLARFPDVDLTLTTNGALLARNARSLRDAGLTRVTVSIDSLDDATFAR